MTQYSLVLYSGGQNRANVRLHQELIRLARQKTDGPLRMTYLPFCADGSETYFMRSVKRYARFGVDSFCCLRADQRPSASQIRSALNTHIVYLAGGNTFYFLQALRRSGLLSFLKDFADQGGIFAGLSAGAHILSPHIGLAGAVGLDPDENEVGLKNFKALGLVPFEVLPHFDKSPGKLAAIQRYSRRSVYPIYACPDGAGIVVEKGKVRPLGRGVRLYFDGMEL
ncbi:Type 1 glutamine amidotransferase-like domain-containing protein [Bdellovibrionota bacterium FG-1]